MSPQIDDETRRRLLRGSRLFANLGTEELDGLLSLTHAKRVDADQVIFLKGDRAAQLYAIASGLVRVSTVSDDGKVMVFGIFGPGELFGEVALLDGRERTATVTAVSATELLVIDRRDFLPFLEKHPKVSIQLLSALAGRVRSASQLVEDALFLPLPARLAKKLLFLADNFGTRHGKSIRIDLKLSQQELGNLVGTTRESINKALRAWEDDGTIKTEQGFISIEQPDHLRHISGFVDA